MSSFQRWRRRWDQGGARISGWNLQLLQGFLDRVGELPMGLEPCTLQVCSLAFLQDTLLGYNDDFYVSEFTSQHQDLIHKIHALSFRV
jgi:hypothetical protein